jgi:hypothetical protein
LKTVSLRIAGLALACLVVAGVAHAQTTTSAQPAAASPSQSDDQTLRVATPTYTGDTGLWFVPTADVTPWHKWSGSVYRGGFNYEQGFTNVGEFEGTFSVGVWTGTEIFGSVHVDTRIDRDLRPLFTSNPDAGGVVLGYPRANQYWSGDNFGDTILGLKSQLISEERGKPVSLAARVLQAADRELERRHRHRQV